VLKYVAVLYKNKKYFDNKT